MENVSFYKRREYIFDGDFLGTEFANISIDPPGFVNILGNLPVDIIGTYQGNPVNSIGVERISTEKYDSIITFSVGSGNSFEGTIQIVSEDGSVVPVDRLEFTTLAEVSRHYLKTPSSAFKEQNLPGNLAEGKGIHLTVQDGRIQEIDEGDYCLINSEVNRLYIEEISQLELFRFMLTCRYMR